MPDDKGLFYLNGRKYCPTCCKEERFGPFGVEILGYLSLVMEPFPCDCPESNGSCILEILPVEMGLPALVGHHRVCE